MRDEIIFEIKRVAASTGKAPGRRVFERETGIGLRHGLASIGRVGATRCETPGSKRTINRARRIAISSSKRLSPPSGTPERVPAYSELRLYARTDPEFPAHSTISNRFRGKGDLIRGASGMVRGQAGICRRSAMLPAPVAAQVPTSDDKPRRRAFVLIKSGNFYKIGRSDELEPPRQRDTDSVAGRCHVGAYDPNRPSARH